MRHFPRASRAGRKYQDATDATLIAALRRDDRWAWAEYFARFYPVLEQYARRARIPRSEWHACINDVMDDAAMRFTADRAVLPRSLTHYLIVSVRHRFLNVVRAQELRRQKHDEAMATLESHDERVVRTVCSEASLGASRSPYEELHPLRRSLRRLALAIVGGLTEAEWELLSYLGEQVPIATIAEWFGVSYDTAAQRSSRLRHRLRAAAHRHAATFPEEEQAELRRFFDRARRGASRGSRERSGGSGSGGDAA